MTWLALAPGVAAVVVAAAVVAVTTARARLGGAGRQVRSGWAVPGRDQVAARLVLTTCWFVTGAAAALWVGAWGAPWTGTPPPATSTAVAALAVAAAVQAVLGDLVPAAVAGARPSRVPPTLTRWVDRLLGLVAPLAGVVGRLGAAVAAVVPAEDDDEATGGREQLRRVLRASEKGGSISHADARMLERSLRFTHKTAADVLTPRVEVRSLPASATVADLVALSASTGLSRFPVHGADLDDVVGVAHVKDVLGRPADGRGSVSVTEMMRPAPAVPESKPLVELMGELRAGPGQFALVVDEYGGTSGLVTLEDLVEEIVGEIDDEHDVPRPTPAATRWQGAHLVPGGVRRDELEQICGLAMPEGAFETLGGLVMDRLGRIPARGDRVDLDGWDLEVVRMDGHRVATVRVVAPSPGMIDPGARP